MHSYDQHLARQVAAHTDAGGPSATVTFTVEREVTVTVEDGAVSDARLDGLIIALTDDEKSEAVERARESNDGEAEQDAELAAECRGEL